MGRIRSALFSLYGEEAAWEKTEPAVQVVRPTETPLSDDNGSSGAAAQSDDHPSVSQTGEADEPLSQATETESGAPDTGAEIAAEGPADSCAEPEADEGLDVVTDVESPIAAEPADERSDDTDFETKATSEAEVADDTDWGEVDAAEVEVEKGESKTQPDEQAAVSEATDEIAVEATLTEPTDRDEEPAIDAQAIIEKLLYADSSEEPTAETASESESLDVADEQAHEPEVSSPAISASAFEFGNDEEDLAVADDSGELHPGNSEVDVKEDSIDQSQDVLNLVQQVLGISDRIRQSDEELPALQTTNESTLEPAAEDEETPQPDDSSQAECDIQAAVQDPQGVAEQALHDNELPPPHLSDREHADSEENSQFQPVLQTWANVPVDDDFSATQESPTAEAAPPLSNTPISEKDQTRESGKLADSLISESTLLAAAPAATESAAETCDDASDGNSRNESESPPIDDLSEGVLSEDDLSEDDLSEESEADETHPEFYLPPVEELPEVAASATQAWSPAISALAGLPEKVTPFPFERTIAARVLETDFGDHVQEMSQRLAEELSKPPITILFLSLEEDPQRAEIVTGLAMHTCAQRDAPTLLVDADVQSKWISRQFEHTQFGLVECFDDRQPWYDLVTATSCESLRFLGCGGGAESGADKGDDHPSGLREASATLFQDWKVAFGLVLIDGGTVNGPLVPDLAELADATYLTVNLGSDEREQLAQVAERLGQFGARLKGCITTGPTS